MNVGWDGWVDLVWRVFGMVGFGLWIGYEKVVTALLGNVLDVLGWWSPWLPRLNDVNWSF
jgi:hypothetical protein